jgi:hypothetical protein
MSLRNNPEQKEPETPRPEDTTTESHKAAEQPPLTEVDVLHALVNEYKARDNHNSRLQGRNFWLGVVTACLVFVYATVAALQWCATEEANQIARDALVSSTRPWIGFVPVGDIQSVEVGKMPMVTLLIQNFGKSPAFYVTVSVGITLVPLAFPEGPLIEAVGKGRIWDVGTLWPDGGKSISTVTYPEVLTERQMREITDEKLQLTVVGQIVYRDGSSGLHHTWIQIVYRPALRGLNAVHPQDAPPDD